MILIESEPPVILRGECVELEPLKVEHAQVMAPLLDDPGLHAFIGGRPATFDELQERYRRQVVGRSSDDSQRWFNWVVRRREDGLAIGTVQATVTDDVDDGGGPTAEVAWVVAIPHQGRGYAREAARLMVAWLRAQGVRTILAHVHPEHEASRAVARALGLVETTVVVDGETRWQDSTPRPSTTCSGHVRTAAARDSGARPSSR